MIAVGMMYDYPLRFYLGGISLTQKPKEAEQSRGACHSLSCAALGQVSSLAPTLTVGSLRWKTRLTRYCSEQARKWGLTGLENRTVCGEKKNYKNNKQDGQIQVTWLTIFQTQDKDLKELVSLLLKCLNIIWFVLILYPSIQMSW